MAVVSADCVSWNLRGGRVLGPAPFFVVGIVNVTPDSFYDQGRTATAPAAVTRGLELLAQGASMLDVGGESTRPFAVPISENEELERVLPVVHGILAARPDALLSVDTTKASVARACLEAGAVAINDVSAWRVDPTLLDVLVEYQPGYVLMHSQGSPQTMQIEPQYANVVDEIWCFFESGLEQLVRAGLAEEQVVLDPGIGFGKTLDHNVEILQQIHIFQKLGRPIYLGLSNKSLWRDLLGREGHARNAATLAATAVVYAHGARIHRVHEVQATQDALVVAQTLNMDQGKGQC